MRSQEFSMQSIIPGKFDPGSSGEFSEAPSRQALFGKSALLPSHTPALNSCLILATAAPGHRRELTLSPDNSSSEISSNTSSSNISSGFAAGAMRAIPPPPTPHSSAQPTLEFADASDTASSTTSTASIIPASGNPETAELASAQPDLNEHGAQDEEDAGLCGAVLHSSGSEWPPPTTRALGSLSRSLCNTISHDTASQLSAPAVDGTFDQDSGSEWRSQSSLLDVDGMQNRLPAVRAVTRTYSEDEVGGSAQLGEGGRGDECDGEDVVDDDLVPEDGGGAVGEEGESGVATGDGAIAAAALPSAASAVARYDKEHATPPWSLHGSSANEAHVSESTAKFDENSSATTAEELPPRAMSLVGARGKIRMFPPPLQITTTANGATTYRYAESVASCATSSCSIEDASADGTSAGSSSNSATSDPCLGREDSGSSGGSSGNSGAADTDEPATPVPRPRGKGGKGTLKLMLLKAESKEFVESVASAAVAAPGFFTPPSNSGSNGDPSSSSSSSSDSLGLLLCPNKPRKSPTWGNKRGSSGSHARRPRAPSLGSSPTAKGGGGGMPHGLGSPKKPMPPPQFVSSRPNSKHRFWALVWPSLAAAGWHLEPGKRKRDNDYYFIPPNTNRETARYRVDYFDSVKSVLHKAAADERFASCLQDYESAEASALAERAAETVKIHPVSTISTGASSGARASTSSAPPDLASAGNDTLLRSPASASRQIVNTTPNDACSNGAGGGDDDDNDARSRSDSLVLAHARRVGNLGSLPRAKRLKHLSIGNTAATNGCEAEPESPCTPSAFAPPPSLVSPTAREASSSSGGRSRRAPRKVVKFDPSSNTAASTPTSSSSSAAGLVRTSVARASPSRRRSGSESNSPFSPRTRSPSNKSLGRSTVVNHSNMSSNNYNNSYDSTVSIRPSVELHAGLWPTQRSNLDNSSGLAMQIDGDDGDVNDALLLPLLDHSDVAFVPSFTTFAPAAASTAQAVPLASESDAQSFKPMAMNNSNLYGYGVSHDRGALVSSREPTNKHVNYARSACPTGTDSSGKAAQPTAAGTTAWQPSATAVVSLDNFDPFNGDIADVFGVGSFNHDFE